MSKKRMEVIVLGRSLGTAEGWDQVDDHTVHFYDFKPHDGIPLPSAYGISFGFEKGFVEAYDDYDAVIFSSDLVSEISVIPRKEPL